MADQSSHRRSKSVGAHPRRINSKPGDRCLRCRIGKLECSINSGLLDCSECDARLPFVESAPRIALSTTTTAIGQREGVAVSSSDPRYSMSLNRRCAIQSAKQHRGRSLDSKLGEAKRSIGRIGHSGRASLIPLPKLKPGTASPLDAHKSTSNNALPCGSLPAHVHTLKQIADRVNVSSVAKEKAFDDMRLLYTHYNVRSFSCEVIAAALLFHHDQSDEGLCRTRREFCEAVPSVTMSNLDGALKRVVDRVRSSSDRVTNPNRFLPRIIHRLGGDGNGERLRELEKRTLQVIEEMREYNMVGGRDSAGIAGAAFQIAVETLYDESMPDDKEFFKHLSAKTTPANIGELLGVHRQTVTARYKEYWQMIDANSAGNGAVEQRQSELAQLQALCPIGVGITLRVSTLGEDGPVSTPTEDDMEHRALLYQAMRDGQVVSIAGTTEVSAGFQSNFVNLPLPAEAAAAAATASAGNAQLHEEQTPSFDFDDMADDEAMDDDDDDTGMDHSDYVDLHGESDSDTDRDSNEVV